MKTFLVSIFLAIAVSGTSYAASPQPVVKMSSSGICHTQASAWYGRTKNFTAFSNLETCLAKGGRLPKAVSTTTQVSSASSSSTYNRTRDFGSWLDEDGDCMNTRHELLASLSTGPITTSGCRVIHGRWNDPYTGLIFTESSQLDIDHIVPLKWAWDHGADKWSQKQRLSFANDERNLLAVKASANRAKSADGPLDWLPPNQDYQCEYVLRFKRLALTWKLEFGDQERQNIDALQNRLCD
jgi:hypothetical protein